MVARRDVARTLAMAEELLAVASEHRLALPRATAMFSRVALAVKGQVEEGARGLEAGIEMCAGAAPRSTCRTGWVRSRKARPRFSQHATALGVLDRALHLVERTGERWFEPYLHLSMGELLLSGPAAPPVFG